MKILNQAQAEAVYSAMCALNNVNGAIRGAISLDGCEVRVSSIYGDIDVRGSKLGQREHYNNQATFAAAYGLDGDPEMVQYLGRKFKVLAKLPEADSDAANAFMEANPNAAFLCIQGGFAYLADVNDKGVPA